jgi:predicted HicB family RNase H-like nuclease
MAKKSSQKGQAPTMKRIHIVVEEALHRAMKAQAARAGKTVKGFLTELIQQAVEKGEKN